MPNLAPSRPSGLEPAADPLMELATLLARGYIRSLARKAAPVAENGAPESELGLDDAAEKSVHGGRLTDGERP